MKYDSTQDFDPQRVPSTVGDSETYRQRVTICSMKMNNHTTSLTQRQCVQPFIASGPIGTQYKAPCTPSNIVFNTIIHNKNCQRLGNLFQY